MKQILLNIFSCAALLPVYSANAQLSTNICVNDALVADLHAAADRLGFDCAVIVGDTVTIENDITLNRLSLVVLCTHIKSRANTITGYPYKQDSAHHGADGKGLSGSQISLFSKTAVRGSVTLPGANGKAGEDGRDGRSGQKPAGPAACCGAQNKGRVGGNGQNGFPGGNGGNVSVMTLTSKDSSVINLAGDGGKGGAGGKAGKGGTSYARANNRPPRTGVGRDGPQDLNPYRITQEKDGKPGKNGKDGAIASLVLKKITRAEFHKELQKYGVDSLGGSQSAFTTLINLKTPQQPRRVVRPAVPVPVRDTRRNLNQ